MANQGENQKQYCDNHNTRRLQTVDGELGMWLGGPVRWLPLWLGGGHDDIVAAGTRARGLTRDNASFRQVVRV